VPQARDPVLLVGFDSDVVGELLAPLSAAGLPLRLGTPGDVAHGPWTLVVAPPQMAGLGGLELLAGRTQQAGGLSPLLLVGTDEQFARLEPTAADARIGRLSRPFAPEALVEAVLAMRRRPDAAPGSAVSVPGGVAEPVLRILDAARFREVVDAERLEQRSGRSPGESFVVSLRFDELDRYVDRLDAKATAALWLQVAEQAGLQAVADEAVAAGEAGDFLMLLPSINRRGAMRRLRALSRRLAAHAFDLFGQATRFSPAIGFAPLRGARDASDAIAKAREAARHSALHLDLEPAIFRQGRPERATAAVPAWRQRIRRLRTRTLLWEQYLITSLVGIGLPFSIYWLFGHFGYDISYGVYLCVVAALVLTAASIWLEGLLALRREDPPDEPARPYPPATAIIAAYLPNEAPIIEDTVHAFLRVQYPAPLQIILAYNTPRDMPEIEDRLAEISREDPRFVPMRVRTSTSKAQNVNAALPYVTGEFTAVFDADHHPDPPSFRRAWRWISHGADVVQGHCLIRNGDESWVARMIAVEFEQIYAVNHPGRARLHGFGIFGGSNGYWRTELLRELRMHGFMLTEDIDSSLRAVVRGRRIVSDPYLVSRELAPETMAALTRQRLRWAQGWYQITAKWALAALRSPRLTLRQKIGMFHLLAWREAFPWISMQILPLILYWVVRAGSISVIDWFVPLFVVTTLFTLTTGPGQIGFIYRLADPQIKRRGRWFVFYVVATTLFYGGLKNAWARIAHLKEALGETAWVVTTRTRPKP
jgi:cellulose synthase/poly-beta-1,6-N-acetylglucosamine synthase-like glycosyltransferase/GGDEF domain-containing protein